MKLFLTKVREGGGQKQIVKNRSTPFCMIYYSIWPNQFPTSCGKCPLLFYEGFLYAYKVCKNPFKGNLCLSVCTPDPQKVIGIIENVRGIVQKKTLKF